jgi:hypothetical protein
MRSLLVSVPVFSPNIPLLQLQTSYLQCNWLRTSHCLVVNSFLCIALNFVIWKNVLKFCIFIHETLTKLQVIFIGILWVKNVQNKKEKKPAAVIKNRNFSRRGHRQRKESGGWERTEWYSTWIYAREMDIAKAEKIAKENLQAHAQK